MSKKYDIIYADPPWKFSNKKTGGSMKSGADAQYDTMTLADLKALPVESIASDNCVLVMWWVGSQPQEALDLVDAWGFTIKNMNGFVWVKLTKNLLSFFGMGFWTRAGSESALIAIKGKPKAKNRGVRAVRYQGIMGAIKDFLEEAAYLRHAVVGRHSEKPAAFRDDIIQMCGNVPRIELFARHKADGWDVWGNEVESTKGIMK